MTDEDIRQLAIRIRKTHESAERVERQTKEYIRGTQSAFFDEVGKKIGGAIEPLNAELRPDGIELTFSHDPAEIRIVTGVSLDARASLELKPAESSVVFRLRLSGQEEVTDLWKFDTEPGPKLVLGQPRAGTTAVKFSAPEEVCDFVIGRVFDQ